MKEYRNSIIALYLVVALSLGLNVMYQKNMKTIEASYYVTNR